MNSLTVQIMSGIGLGLGACLIPGALVWWHTAKAPFLRVWIVAWGLVAAIVLAPYGSVFVSLAGRPREEAAWIAYSATVLAVGLIISFEIMRLPGRCFQAVGSVIGSFIASTVLLGIVMAFERSGFGSGLSGFYLATGVFVLLWATWPRITLHIIRSSHRMRFTIRDTTAIEHDKVYQLGGTLWILLPLVAYVIWIVLLLDFLWLKRLFANPHRFAVNDKVTYLLVLGMLNTWLIGLFFHARSAWNLRECVAGYCASCRYDLRGLPVSDSTTCCPECGTSCPSEALAPEPTGVD